MRRRELVPVAVSALLILGAVAPAVQAAEDPAVRSGADYCSEAYSQNHPTIGVGSAGDAVRHAQCKLGKWGHPVTIDGIFGTETYNAVRAVQGDCNLTRDGIVGPKTWRCLD